MTTETTYGKELRRIRIEQNLSLKHLGDVLGLSSTEVSAVERTDREPLTINQTERVLDFMGRVDDRERMNRLIDAYWESTCDGRPLEFMKDEPVWWISENGSCFAATVISHIEPPEVRVAVPGLLEDDMCVSEDDVFKHGDWDGIVNRLEIMRGHITRSITRFRFKKRRAASSDD